MKSLGCDCAEFIELYDDWYTEQVITYRDSSVVEKKYHICVKAMLKWMFKAFNNDMWGYRYD